MNTVNAHLESEGLLYREGTIVDASIISAPTSTKNKSRERDPEMHQTNKGNQWYFGMKMHIGVDETFGTIHSMSTSAANVHDVTRTADLLHGQEKTVHADAGYRGTGKRDELKDMPIDWEIACGDLQKIGDQIRESARV